MTCKDCLHYEVCKHHDAVVDFPVDDGVCRFFEDRTKWVEQKHGRWYRLDECSNAGVYCSVCHKKVYKESYANQKLKSKYCPNCGSRMDGDFVAY